VPPHVHTDFVVTPPSCGRSVTDIWGSGAHSARLCCPDDVPDYMCERGIPEGALNLSSTSYPDRGRFGDLPLQGKIPTAEPGIEPGTSRLVATSSDHQAMRLVAFCNLKPCQLVTFYPEDWFSRFLRNASSCLSNHSLMFLLVTVAKASS
jgi:hypothetical protein